jgi:hypothetical protein
MSLKRAFAPKRTPGRMFGKFTVQTCHVEHEKNRAAEGFGVADVRTPSPSIITGMVGRLFPLFSPVEKSVTETSIQNETNEGDGR